MTEDSTPMFVDPDFIRRTWKAMVKALRSGEAEKLGGSNELGLLFGPGFNGSCQDQGS